MKSERRKQLPVLIGAAVFLLGGFDAFQNQYYLVGVPSVLAGVANLVAAYFAKNSPRSTSLIVQVLNIAMAVIMATATVLAGKRYIQYAWAIAALFFVVLAIREFRETRTATSVNERKPE